jgi:hypothetical protein
VLGLVGGGLQSVELERHTSMRIISPIYRRDPLSGARLARIRNYLPGREG